MAIDRERLTVAVQWLVAAARSLQAAESALGAGQAEDDRLESGVSGDDAPPAPCDPNIDIFGCLNPDVPWPWTAAITGTITY